MTRGASFREHRARAWSLREYRRGAEQRRERDGKMTRSHGVRSRIHVNDAPQYSDAPIAEKARGIMRLRIVRICVAATLLAGGHARGQDETSAFVPSSQCIACHAQVTAASGEDISIGPHWRATIMANSARDPYWHAAVRREVLDHPAVQDVIEDTCSTCHMPMARFDAAAAGGQGKVFANIATAAPRHEL